MSAETIPEIVEVPQVVTITTPDGWMVDAETGEVVGHAEVMVDPREPETFRPFNLGYAEWVLDKMQSAEALIVADEMKLRAISDNIQRRIRDQRARLEWLQRRFGADLEQLARRELDGAKTRTLILDHGKLSFRRSAGSIKVADPGQALEWARVHAPEAIKVAESVLVTPLKGRADLPAGVFEVTGPEDRFTVETGIR